MVDDDSTHIFWIMALPSIMPSISPDTRVGRLYRIDFKTVYGYINFYLQAYLGFNHMVTDFQEIAFILVLFLL